MLGFPGAKSDGVEEWMDLYTENQMREFWELKAEAEPGLAERVQAQWATLIQDVNDQLALDPASPDAQALALRWAVLAETTFRGKDDFRQAMESHYREGRLPPRPGLTPETFAFIDRATATLQKA